MQLDTVKEQAVAESEPADSAERHLSASSLPLTFPRLVWSVQLLYFGAIGLVVLMDQLSKAWVVANLPEYQAVDLAAWLVPVLSLTSVRNTGVAFGLFQGSGHVFAVLSIIVVIAILVFRRTIPSSETWVHAALGLVTGGALGNIVDRFTRGYVVDFLDANFWPFQNWPVFNLADSAIVAGAALLLLDSFVAEYRARRADA